jgi:hypothetical protein
MVVGPDSPESSLGNLVGLLGGDFPAVDLSDDPSPKCMTHCQWFSFISKSW